MGRAMTRSRLHAVPCTRTQAQAFVAAVHRHHKPAVSGVFCLACVDETGAVRGVAMVGRPVARGACDGFTLEVNRVATDGCANACSFLLGAARRVAFDLGYRKIITYTLPEEGGASLRGAGWFAESAIKGRRAPEWLSVVTWPNFDEGETPQLDLFD